MSRSVKIMGVIFCAAAVVFTAAAVLTLASAAKYAAVVGAVAAAVMFFLDRRAKQTGIAVKNGFMMLVSLFAFFNILLCSISPWVVHSEYKWQYPFQKAYIGLYQNIKEPEFFPDFMNDVRSGYEFDYLPSIMQGAGHYSVTFVTTPERAAEVARVADAAVVGSARVDQIAASWAGNQPPAPKVLESVAALAKAVRMARANTAPAAGVQA